MTTTAGGGSTTAPARTTTTAANPSGGCTSGSSAVPSGAQFKQVVDVDGDGKPDTAWVTIDNGHVMVGIVTAAGGGTSVPFESASPIERSVFVVNADNTGPVEVIFSDGRGASLHAFSDCAIKPVLNPQGQPYTFDLGDRIGTGSGIGCVGTGSGRRLVGFNIDSSQSAVVRWSYTPILLSGLHAHNGTKVHREFHLPADQAKVDVLNDISCGSQTIEADGVTTH